MMEKARRTVIVGGGAGGMAAAIAAAESGERVTVLERMDRVGKKLLATGNGRCNLMNMRPPCYPGGGGFAAEVLARFGAKEQIGFWHTHGLYLRREDDGRVYPACGQASAVLDVMRLAMDNAGVEVRTSQEVTNVAADGRRWRVSTAAGEILCDRVIIAGGGLAQPKLGSNGSCYGLLTALGHRLVKPRPALTQIETDVNVIRGLSGIRIRCGVSVEGNGRTLHTEAGEALFTDYGVSGVCVMQCARYAQAGGTAVLNLLEGLGQAGEACTAREMRREMRVRRERWSARPMETLLSGICVPRLSLALGRAAGVAYRDRVIGTLSDGEMDRLVRVMERFELPIRGVKGYETAQVTRGGLDVADFRADTLESRLAPGVYAVGEVLDVDGDCGGFNLMFAFGSGILAGLNGRENPYGGN